MKRRNSHLFVLLSALLASAGMVFPAGWLLVLPGLAIFFHLLRDRVRGNVQAFGAGLVYGVITGGAGIIWFWDTLPLDFLEIASSTAQRAGVAITWAYVAFALGIPVAFGAVIIWWCRRLRWFPLFAGLVWVAIELGRMWSFAIFTWSPSSLLGPHFSAAAAGYALAENRWLLQIARPFGLNMLNFVVASVAAMAACWPRERDPAAWRIYAAQGVALAGLFVLVPWWFLEKAPAIDSKSPRLRVAILAEQIENAMYQDYHVVTTQLIRQAAAARPPVDVVLIPEEISLTSIFWYESEAEQFLRETFGYREVLLLHTRAENYLEHTDPDAITTNKMLYYESTTQGIVGHYTKQMLMPLGEYAPMFARAFYSIIGDPDIAAHLEDVNHIRLHVTPPATVTYRGVRFGALLCSDLLSPELYRHQVREGGAVVLINLANQFWFHGSRTLHWKSLQMARVHAVSNQRPLLVANNLSPSYALDARGRMLVSSRWGERTVLYLDVP